MRRKAPRHHVRAPTGLQWPHRWRHSLTVIRAASLASLSPARLGPPLHFLPPARVPPLRAPRRPSPRRALRLIADPTQTPRPAACRDHTHSKHSRREPRTSQTEPQPLLRTQKEMGGDDSGLTGLPSSLSPPAAASAQTRTIVTTSAARCGRRGPAVAMVMAGAALSTAPPASRGPHAPPPVPHLAARPLPVSSRPGLDCRRAAKLPFAVAPTVTCCHNRGIP